MTGTIKILAIETASEACSAALLIAGEDTNTQKTYARIETTPRQHAKLILSMLDEVLEEGGIQLKDIDAIAFGRGPGAFTGLRIAAGVAQGVALSVDKSVVAVSTLSALAQQTLDNTENSKAVAVAMDARMGEVYWAVFKNNKGKAELIGKEQVSPPQTMLENVLKLVGDESQVFAVGSGWDAYAEALDAKPDNLKHLKELYPTATDIAKLALPLFIVDKTVKPEEAQPVYIRNNVAKKSADQ